MAIAINLNDLCYPDAEIQAQILADDWPDMQPYQWAILVGSPFLLAPVWDMYDTDNVGTMTAGEIMKQLNF
jgi:hypothetical protein